MTSRSRSHCLNCQRKLFLQSEAENDRIKRFARARYYKNLAESLKQRIALAKRVIVTHPCSPTCRDEIIEIRRQFFVVKSIDLKRKRLMLENAERLYKEAQTAFAEANLMEGPESAKTIKAKQRLTHYKTLVAQRSRRLAEAENMRAEVK